MIVKKLDPDHVDSRGAITDILLDESIEHISLVEFTAGAVRGNHFHGQTNEWIFVLRGALRYVVQGPGGSVQDRVVTAGHLLKNEPMHVHALEALEPSSILELTRTPRGERHYETDTYLASEPLIRDSD